VYQNVLDSNLRIPILTFWLILSFKKTQVCKKKTQILHRSIWNWGNAENGF